MKRQILIFLMFLSCLFGLTQAEQLYYRSDFTVDDVRYGDPYEAGNKFVTGSEPPTITALGYIDLHNTNPAVDPDGDGLIEEHRVTLWLDSDGSKVTEVIVPAGTGGQLVGSFRYAAIPEGVIKLEANTAYVVSAKMTNVEDAWLEEEELTPDYYFIGDNIDDSTTWEPRWGFGGDIPDMQYHTGWFYGNVNIWAGVPTCAFEPVPEDDAIGVGTPVDDTTVDVDMSWKTGLDRITQEVNAAITSHYLYITDANSTSFEGVDPITISAGSPTEPTAEYTLTGAAYDTTYYWRVDESVNDSGPEDPNTIIGGVWDFTTLPEIPLITGQPEDTIVAAGGAAIFSITVVSPEPPDYQWYESEDDVAKPQTDTLLSGEEADTFVLSNVQPADAGTYYFCVVTNTEGSVVSETALLEVERLMGWWKLDGDLTDSSGNGWDGVMEDPNFAAGIIDQAQEFFKDGRFTEITGSGDAFNNYDMAGMTVSAWIKSTNDDWGEFASKQYINPDPEVWEQVGWVMGLDTAGAAYFEIRGGASTYPTSTPVNDNQWHLLTTTFDKTTGIAAMYIDGELEKEGSPSMGSIEMTDRELIFGAGENTGDSPYEGLLDDVRIWNYPKSVWDVIDMYNEIIEPDKNVCIEEYASHADISGPDGEPDCKIDMYDLVEFAAGWLECGLYPNCP